MKVKINKGQTDCVVAVSAIVLSFFLLVSLDGFEAIYEFTRRFEEWELDEVVLLVFAMPLPIAWLAYRRGKSAVAAERQRRQAERELAHFRKVDSLGVLAGGLAHELNNQLVPVLSLSESLLENAPRDHQDRRKLELIFKGVTGSKETVSKVLAFAHRKKHEKSNCEVSQAIQGLIPMLRLSCPSDVSLSIDLEEEIGTVALSATEIESIVVNLFSNATDAMQEGKGRLALICRRLPVGNSVELSGSSSEYIPPEQWAEIRIEDEGIGISEDHASQVFDPFFTTKEVGEGSGLGLTYAQGIVKSIGGEIALNSENGRGTSVVVQIPIQDID